MKNLVGVKNNPVRKKTVTQDAEFVKKSTPSLCYVCNAEVKNTHKALECEIFEDWFHIDCFGSSKKSSGYECLTVENGVLFHWFCTGCNKSAEKL